MTQEHIQHLIDRYLDGETTPEEEKQLSQALRSVCGGSIATLPPDWQAILLMLDPLAQGEAEYDSIMKNCQPKARTVSLYPWRWVAPLLAVAASLLLFFVFSRKAETSPEPHKPLIARTITPKEVEQKQDTKETVEDSHSVVETAAVTSEKKPVASPVRKEVPAVVVLPDTLGDGIWQREENVQRAMQMLADCEATIMREEQEIRNNIIETTFRATPQPANAILVTNELGDYEVIEPRTIIEI